MTLKSKIILAFVVLANMIVTLFFGAGQLGLLKASPSTLSTVYCITLLFYAVISFAIATFIGDVIAKKYFGYDSDYDERWMYWAAGDSHFSDGVGMRIIVHLVLQAPCIYLGALYVRHALS